MADKRYKRKDGKRCARCWRNKLKHGNKLKKKNGGRTQATVREILDNDSLTNNQKKEMFIKSDYFVHSTTKVQTTPWKFVETYESGSQYKSTRKTGRNSVHN